MHWNSLVTDKYNIVAIRTILVKWSFHHNNTTKETTTKGIQPEENSNEGFNCTTNHTALLSFT